MWYEAIMSKQKIIIMQNNCKFYLFADRNNSWAHTKGIQQTIMNKIQDLGNEIHSEQKWNNVCKWYILISS